MIIQRVYQFMFAGMMLLLLASVMSAMAATNVVAPSGLGEFSESVTINDLKPSECSGLDLTNLITGSGTISGTLKNDLILGSAGADTISGEGGDDCIFGGGGNDNLYGGPGNDVCLGGSGVDSMDATCEAQH